ncbi:hypothetical protein LLG96_13830 [bacterium]|nr:hypothetical protein [bacterium]
MKKLTRYSIIALVLAGLGMCAFSCEEKAPVVSPLGDSGQVLLTIAESDSIHTAELFAFHHTGEGWIKDFSCPAVIGGNGFGWGRGLHNPDDRDPSEPVKREGDGKSPMGVFELVHAWGYLPRTQVDTRFPYTMADSSLICIDDVRSEYYNMVVNMREKSLDPGALPSHETMLRDDDYYKYTILVGHNMNPVVQGAGCCIFLHLWGGENSSTAGCTAMSEPDMVKLLAWLDPEQKPVIVQLTRKSYFRLREHWKLPGIPGDRITR